MPMTALIRNLSKLSTLEIISGTNPEFEKYVDFVVERITNPELLKRARIHPISVLLASSIYASGQGLRGKLKWVVNDKIKKALDDAFLLAFNNVEPTGMRYCLAIDVSGFI